jgi:hypothetical protein
MIRGHRNKREERKLTESRQILQEDKERTHVKL